MSKSQTPLLDGLTTLEQQVVDASRCGDWAGPNTMMRVEEIEAADDEGLWVRSELIRELLMGRRGDLDPHGVRLQGIRLVGRLDLDHVTAVSGLTLAECVLRDGITCIHARLRDVNLYGSHLSGLSAGNLCTDGNMTLRQVTMVGSDDHGLVWLSGAHIGGRLDLDRAVITNDTGPALDGERLRTDNSAFLRSATLRGVGKDGAV